MPTVGIIGGMGPEATLDLFQKIISNSPASRDQEHLHVLVDNDPSIPDRTAFLLGEGPSPLPKLLKAARKLVAAGATVLCMPCNTAHYFVEELRTDISTPFISIVESCQDEILSLAQPVRRVGLLATRGTYQGRVYHQILERHGLEILAVDEHFQMKLMEVIYAVKAGRRSDVSLLFDECLYQMQAAGAEVIVAGCTEIPLLLNDADVPLPVIDPTLTLARAVVRHCQKDEASLSIAVV